MSYRLNHEKEIEHFLETIEESSKHVRFLLFMLFLTSIYVVVAAYTGDWQNETLTLPIIDSEISRRWFFAIAPVFVLFNYVYMHLYLKDLIKRMELYGQLPIETNFLPKSYLFYPWMLPISEEDMKKETRGFGAKFTFFCVNIAFWWYGPFVLLVILMAYIFQQDIWALVPYSCFCLSVVHYVMNSREEKTLYKKFLFTYLSCFLFFITLTAVPAIPIYFGFEAIDNQTVAATFRAFITAYVVIYAVFFGIPKNYKSDKSKVKKAMWYMIYAVLICLFVFNLLREHNVPFE